MPVPEIDLRNHLLNHVQQILFRPLPYFTGRQARGRMSQKEAAHSFRDLQFGDQRVHAIGQSDNLLEALGLNFQMLHGPIITVRLGALAQLD